MKRATIASKWGLSLLCSSRMSLSGLERRVQIWRTSTWSLSASLDFLVSCRQCCAGPRTKCLADDQFELIILKPNETWMTLGWGSIGGLSCTEEAMFMMGQHFLWQRAHFEDTSKVSIDSSTGASPEEMSCEIHHRSGHLCRSRKRTKAERRCTLQHYKLSTNPVRSPKATKISGVRPQGVFVLFHQRSASWTKRTTDVLTGQSCLGGLCAFCAAQLDLSMAEASAEGRERLGLLHQCWAAAGGGREQEMSFLFYFFSDSFWQLFF